MSETSRKKTLSPPLVSSTILLSTAYLPNIQYFSKLLSEEDICIEVWDTYQKQSFRNRTSIFGANGKQDLVIPVKKAAGNNTLTRDILLDYDMPWHQIHWKSIVSAYRHSPFFGIFEPELAPLYEKKMKYLIDWNFMLLDQIFRITGTKIKYSVSNEYLQAGNETILDFRDTIHPKKRMQQNDSSFRCDNYFQVFSGKHGFIPNLSFIDLLFNEGSQAIYLCKKCKQKG